MQQYYPCRSSTIRIWSFISMMITLTIELCREAMPSLSKDFYVWSTTPHTFNRIVGWAHSSNHQWKTDRNITSKHPAARNIFKHCTELLVRPRNNMFEMCMLCHQKLWHDWKMMSPQHYGRTNWMPWLGRYNVKMHWQEQKVEALTTNQIFLNGQTKIIWSTILKMKMEQQWVWVCWLAM